MLDDCCYVCRECGLTTCRDEVPSPCEDHRVCADCGPCADCQLDADEDLAIRLLREAS